VKHRRGDKLVHRRGANEQGALTSCREQRERTRSEHGLKAASAGYSLSVEHRGMDSLRYGYKVSERLILTNYKKGQVRTPNYSEKNEGYSRTVKCGAMHRSSYGKKESEWEALTDCRVQMEAHVTT
jgi:hypothetical protein